MQSGNKTTLHPSLPTLGLLLWLLCGWVGETSSGRNGPTIVWRCVWCGLARRWYGNGRRGDWQVTVGRARVGRRGRGGEGESLEASPSMCMYLCTYHKSIDSAIRGQTYPSKNIIWYIYLLKNEKYRCKNLATAPLCYINNVIICRMQLQTVMMHMCMLTVIAIFL